MAYQGDKTGAVLDAKVSGIPNGGVSGQVLTKQTNTDYDTNWEDPQVAQGDLKADGSVDMDAGYIPATDQAISTKKYVDDNVTDGNLKSDGSVPMDAGYTPVALLDIATREFVEANIGGGGDGNLKSDGTVPMDAGYTPANAQDIGTKQYTDDKVGTAGILTFVPVTAASVPNLTMFIDSADGVLKFKRSDGTLREVGLAPVS